MRLLVINANTSPGVTEICAAAARRAAAPGTDIVALTCAFGPTIIESRVENAIAAHAVLDQVAQHRDGAAALLLAVSYATALAAARDLAGCPVGGITQASFATAALIGSRIGLVTFGTPWLYRELAESYGASSRLAGIEVIPASARDAYSDPDRVRQIATQTAGRLVSEAGADVVILCGAAFAGMAEAIQPDVTVPLLDGVTCGTRLCEVLAAMRLPARAVATGPGGIGLSPALTGALYG